MKHVGSEKADRSIDPKPGRHEKVGEWFESMRSRGYLVPVQAPWAISRAMKTFDIGAPDAFEWLVERRLLTVLPMAILVDLRSTSSDLRTLIDLDGHRPH